jgi:hypothetical protein
VNGSRSCGFVSQNHLGLRRLDRQMTADPQFIGLVEFVSQNSGSPRKASVLKMSLRDQVVCIQCSEF